MYTPYIHIYKILTTQSPFPLPFLFLPTQSPIHFIAQATTPPLPGKPLFFLPKQNRPMCTFKNGTIATWEEQSSGHHQPRRSDQSGLDREGQDGERERGRGPVGGKKQKKNRSSPFISLTKHAQYLSSEYVRKFQKKTFRLLRLGSIGAAPKSPPSKRC